MKADEDIVGDLKPLIKSWTELFQFKLNLQKGDLLKLEFVFPLQVFYSFNFWLMFRQQLKERQERQSMKKKSLEEIQNMPGNLCLDFFSSMNEFVNL